MAYYIDLFSPETYHAFSQSPRKISGFRMRHQNAAARIKPGDNLVCYMTRLSRWVGVLEVLEGPFIDNTAIFLPENDPFVVRFRVRAVTWLDPVRAIPIHAKEIWNSLTFTRELDPSSIVWTGKVRGSLVRLEDSDGSFLAQRLAAQMDGGTEYSFTEQDARHLALHKVNRPDKVVTVSVPQDFSEAEETVPVPESEARESIRIQALIANIGAQMGMSIWLPRADRSAVLKEWRNADTKILERLPLNYDDTTLRTIEQIDVLWLRGRSIVRAFEVEHTTSVYSGILRMADLLALQPNMDIKLHIVSPEARRDKVFQEIRRPVFSLLERGPLAESCTYLSYDSVREIGGLKHLGHFSDSVLEEYAEEVE